ncbi:MAG: extracellular solute-binding protein [Caldilineaceae bacterium]|nr:extracellular solute-binding protein [Caldilineaceae bacterium]
MWSENKSGFSRRQFLKASSMLAVGGVLAACAPAAAPSGGTQAEGSGEAATTEGNVVNFWYAWGNFDPAMEQIAASEEWAEIGGGATLEYRGAIESEALLTAIASGTPPDAGSNFDYPNLFARGAAIPVQDLIESSDILKQENILDWVWDYAFFGGEMIGIPGIESYVQYGLNYNTNAVEKAELDPSSPPTTWSEALDWHRALTIKDDAGNLQQIGLDPYDAMGGDVDFGPLSYGVLWFNEETREFDLDNERIADLLDTTAEFYRIAGPDQFAGMRQVSGQGTWGASYNAGVQTMIIEGYWHPGETQIQQPEIAQYNVASWAPMSDDRKDVKMQGVNAHLVQIYKDGKNQQGAVNLGEMFNTVKACDVIFKEVGWIHGVNEFLPTIDADAYPGLRFYIDTIPEVTEWHLLRRCPIHWFMADQQTEIREQVYRDNMSPAEAAAELQRRAEAEWAAQGLS